MGNNVCYTSRCVDSRPRVDLDCHCRCAITEGVRSDLCCHLTNMLYQCKVLRSNHVVQIIFLSFPVVPTGNFCTTGEMETLCRLATIAGHDFSIFVVPTY